MHKVELLEQGLAALRSLDYKIREECVGGSGGGSCVFGGQKWFFVDPTLEMSDQLELVYDALRNDPAANDIDLPGELRRLVAGISRTDAPVEGTPRRAA